MIHPVAALRAVSQHGEESPRWHTLHLWCPGCDALHAVNLVGPDGYRPPVCWEWDGNLEAPTISPSILTRWYGYPRGIDPAPGEVQRPAEQVCHSFLRDGRWEFLGDCTHALAGQTVDMVPLPDWLAREG